jgi:parallel beta-helix repeat protein
MTGFGSPTLSNCIISGNGNPQAGVGGGIICSEANPTITNCIISGNRASVYGGAMYIADQSSPILINCTVVDNIAEGAQIPRYGGIFNGYEGNSTLTNCIVWGNRAIGTHDVEENQIAGDNPVINYCCVEGWSGALGGTGNFGEDPCFVEPGYWDDYNYDWVDGDYHLLTDSSCIDAGYPNFVPALNAKDADGEPRIMGDRVDIGADEVGPKQPDLSRNGTINSEDFTIFTNSWRARPTDDNWYILSDFDRDDFIGFADLGVLTNNWLWQASWYTP